jgi:hypothetical protein
MTRVAEGGERTPLDAARRWLDAAIASPAVRVDVAVLVLVTALAALLRFADLMEVPPGFHGDEGLAGLDGDKIVHEGWIGPYLPSALGTTSGAFYWVAAVFRIFGDSPFTVRFSFAILGVVTVPIAYLAFRLMYGRRVALIASVLLATMFWHIHFSRVAFVPVTWPLMEMATLLFLWLGLRTERLVFFALSGLAFGGGLYGYMIYPIFMVALSLYLLLLLVTTYRHRLLPFVQHMAVFSFCTVLIALPLIQFANDRDSPYWDRFETYSITKSPEYKAADSPYKKVELFVGRARTYFRGFIDSPPFDGADATGIKPILDKVSPFLLVAGLVIAATRWRRPEYVLPFIMLIVLPAGALSSQDAMYRRTLGLAPFFALLAALPLAVAWDRLDKLRDWQVRSAGQIIIAGVILAVGVLNYNLYFDTMRNDPNSKWVFAREIAEASYYLRDLEEKPYVYFYSARWSLNYETRQYLAPNVDGEDRSEEFTTDHTLSLDDIDRSRETLLLFLPPYQPYVTDAMALYPGGRYIEAIDSDGAILFAGYHLPPLTVSAPPQPTR